MSTLPIILIALLFLSATLLPGRLRTAAIVALSIAVIVGVLVT